MRSKLIIDGNAVYEIDEDCMQRKNREASHNMESDFEEHVYENKETAEEDGRGNE